MYNKDVIRSLLVKIFHVVFTHPKIFHVVFSCRVFMSTSSKKIFMSSLLPHNKKENMKKKSNVHDEQHDKFKEISLNNKHLCEVLDPKEIDKIRKAYYIAIVLWIVLVIVCGFFINLGLVGWLVLAIPLIVFFINLRSLDKCSKEVEDYMFDANFLSFSYLIVILIINWDKEADKNKYFKALFISFLLILLSVIDIWVEHENLLISKHIRSMFQTVALTILAYVLFVYYTDQTCGPKKVSCDQGTNKVSCEVA